ncbi:MAG: hypothetical protein AAGI71_19175 [Bacteroidota bacterium]
MSTNSTHLAEVLTQQAAVNARLVEALEHLAHRLAPHADVPLDFLPELSESRTLYVKDNGTHLWHFFNASAPTEEQAVEGIPERFLRCQITGLRVYWKASSNPQKYDDSLKLRIEVRSDRVRDLESALDSAFSRGLLAQIATAGPEAMREPVVLEVRSGTEAHVVLAQLYTGGDRVITRPYRDVSTERLYAGARKALGLPSEAVPLNPRHAA